MNATKVRAHALELWAGVIRETHAKLPPAGTNSGVRMDGRTVVFRENNPGVWKISIEGHHPRGPWFEIWIGDPLGGLECASATLYENFGAPTRIDPRLDGLRWAADMALDAWADTDNPTAAKVAAIIRDLGTALIPDWKNLRDHERLPALRDALAPHGFTEPHFIKDLMEARRAELGKEAACIERIRLAAPPPRLTLSTLQAIAHWNKLNERIPLG